MVIRLHKVSEKEERQQEQQGRLSDKDGNNSLAPFRGKAIYPPLGVNPPRGRLFINGILINTLTRRIVQCIEMTYLVKFTSDAN